MLFVAVRWRVKFDAFTAKSAPEQYEAWSIQSRFVTIAQGALPSGRRLQKVASCAAFWRNASRIVEADG